jgi:hypothetical protein
MRVRLAAFALCLFVSQLAKGQATPTEITNSDVISMTKAGIGEQTIILAIQRGPVKFDTSPLALISLKGGGVSDEVLNAMLNSGERKVQSGSVQQPTNAKANGTAVSPGLTDADRATSFKVGCDSEDMKACFSLSVYYRMGWGVSKDLSQANALLKKACDGGYGDGCTAQQITPSPTSPNKSNAVQAQGSSQGFTLTVLQAQSVPYTQESGGGVSTSCNIVGTSNTSAYFNSYGNSAYGNATTNSNQHMSCNSYDTTMRWPHVLNVMFAQGSDGIAYIIACDRAWRWSKCAPLRAGDVFNAHFTNKGIEIEASNTKGKAEHPAYSILQSKTWR